MKRLFSLFFTALFVVMVCTTSYASTVVDPISDPMAITYEDEWNDILSFTLSDACSWISDSDDVLLQFCLGTAGKTAPTGSVNLLIQTIAKTDVSNWSALELPMQVLNVTFSGYHASNILGTDLISQLVKFTDYTEAETEAVSYAILALDSNPYPVTGSFKNTTSTLTTRLLTYQNEDGGFGSSLSDTTSSTIQTALALTALANYQDDEEVATAIEMGLAYLTTQQQADGSFLENGEESGIAVANVIVALISLGLDLGDERFTTSGSFLTEVLMRYVNVDGGFSVELDGDSDVQTTRAVILALTAIKQNGSPYVMSTTLVETEYVESEVVIIPVEEEAFDWITPLFIGVYLLFLLTLLLYLFLSRFRPLQFWEEYSMQTEDASKNKFNQASAVYQPEDDDPTT